MKYEILHNDTIEHNFRTLYRIRHCSTGVLGGYIEKESNLSQTGLCWVGPHAKVYEDAQVLGNAQVLDNASVGVEAIVKDNTVIKDNAYVGGCALIYGNASIRDRAQVLGWAKIGGSAVIEGSSVINFRADIRAGVIAGNTSIKGDFTLAHPLELKDIAITGYNGTIR